MLGLCWPSPVDGTHMPVAQTRKEELEDGTEGGGCPCLTGSSVIVTKHRVDSASAIQPRIRNTGLLDSRQRCGVRW